MFYSILFQNLIINETSFFISLAILANYAMKIHQNHHKECLTKIINNKKLQTF